MSEEVQKTSMTDLVNDFLADPASSDESCALVFNLYRTLLEIAQENAVLEMENCLLEREIEIANNTIKKLNKELEEPKYVA